VLKLYNYLSYITSIGFFLERLIIGSTLDTNDIKIIRISIYNNEFILNTIGLTLKNKSFEIILLEIITPKYNNIVENIYEMVTIIILSK
jgi:hypothetical protein